MSNNKIGARPIFKKTVKKKVLVVEKKMYLNYASYSNN